MKTFFFLLLISLTNFMVGQHYPHGEHLTDKIFSRVSSKDLLPAYHYGRFGYGGSSSRDYVRLISASFSYEKYASKEEMEDTLIGTIEKVLHAYNTNKKIRPLLVEYPFTQQNVRIAIRAKSANAEHPDAVSWIICVPHPPFYIVYNYWDPVAGREFTTDSKQSETYAEVKARREAARGRPFLED